MGNAHAKFKGCTVDVQAAMRFLIISKLPCCRCTNLPLVPTCCLYHYTSCGESNVHDKFQGCTVDVQAAREFLTIST